MAREIVIVLWCDGEHDEPERATNEHIVVLDDRKPTRLDLCDDHSKLIVELQTMLELGSPVDTQGKPTTKKKKQALPVDEAHACPECGHTTATIQGVNSHMVRVHGYTLAEWRTKHPANA